MDAAGKRQPARLAQVLGQPHGRTVPGAVDGRDGRAPGRPGVPLLLSHRLAWPAAAARPAITDSLPRELASKWEVAVFLGRVGVALGPQELEGRGEARPGVARLDHLVDVAALGGRVRGRQHLAVFTRLVLAQGGRLLGPLHVSPVEDGYRGLGAHDG